MIQVGDPVTVLTTAPTAVTAGCVTAVKDGVRLEFHLYVAGPSGAGARIDEEGVRWCHGHDRTSPAVRALLVVAGLT